MQEVRTVTRSRLGLVGRSLRLHSGDLLNLTSKAVKFGLLAAIRFILPKPWPYEGEIIGCWLIHVISPGKLQIGAERWGIPDLGEWFVDGSRWAGSSRTAREGWTWRHRGLRVGVRRTVERSRRLTCSPEDLSHGGWRNGWVGC